MITRITLYIWGKRKCEKNARIHTRIYESPNLILGGIIIKEKGKKKERKNIYKKRRKGRSKGKEKKRKEKKMMV
jgi:hypothetical protein